MNETIWNLIFYLLLYSVGGWILRVAVAAFKTGSFVNTGLLNGPVSLTSGLSVVVMVAADYQENWIGLGFQFISCMVVAGILSSLSGRVSEAMTGRRLWDYAGGRYFALSGWRGLLRTLMLAAGIFAVVNLVHPYVYIFCQILPDWLVKGIDVAFLAVLAADLLISYYAFHRIKLEPGLAQDMSEALQNTSSTLGEHVVESIRRRLWKAFPEMEVSAGWEEGFGVPDKARVFARGMGPYKLFWIFFISALVGDLIETVYVFATAGIWMNRSSLLYGPFSVVWGFGGVLAAVVLSPLSRKNDRYIFIGGFLMGGVYEYMCSVCTELVFGTVFWDYSDMPFNIGGRTNLLFMFFWGILSLVWVKLLFPGVSRLIEKIPPLAGTVATWCLAVLMVLDMGVTGLAMVRYMERHYAQPTQTAVGQFLDEQYPDSRVEQRWPNMRPVQDS